MIRRTVFNSFQTWSRVYLLLYWLCWYGNCCDSG